jgi:hypothetical protein
MLANERLERRRPSTRGRNSIGVERLLFDLEGFGQRIGRRSGSPPSSTLMRSVGT